MAAGGAAVCVITQPATHAHIRTFTHTLLQIHSPASWYVSHLNCLQLLAFAIGHFDHVAATVSTPVYDAQMQAVAGQTHDCLIRVLTPEGKRSEGEYALKWAVDAYKFYTEGFKFNYPLRKMVRGRTYTDSARTPTHEQHTTQ